jgi:hypothetical protein
MLPPRASFNGNLVPLVEDFFAAGWSPRRRKLVVHIDNAPAHNSRMAQHFFAHCPLKKLPHLPHSPDTSPSDFYAFGKIKSVLIGREIPDEIDL